MLETIREFAVERLQEEGEMLELQRRHAQWVARMAEEAADRLRGPDQQREFERLDSEYGNVSAALVFAAEGDPDLTATIAAALTLWWTTRGRYVEFERWVEPLLGRDLSPLSRARVLSVLISIAAPRGDSDRLQTHGEELLPLSRVLGADSLAGHALFALGSAAFFRGDIEKGRMLYREAIDLARTARPTQVPTYLGNLGWLLRETGELAEARECLDEAVELSRQEGSPHLLARNLSQRANLALDEREFPEALALYHEALTYCRDFGIKARVPLCLNGISVALLGLGWLEEAARLGEAGHRFGVEMTLWSPEDEDEGAAELRDRLGDERYEGLIAEGRSLSEEDAIALALSAASSEIPAPR